MHSLHFRPAEPERDFESLAEIFTILEDWPNTEKSLKEFYARECQRIVQRVAEDERGELLGFFWAEHDRSIPERVFFYLYVRPERRGQGIGSALYDEMVRTLEAAPLKRLRVSVWDTCPEGRAFTDRRGFAEKLHRVAMSLDLKAFDAAPYTETIAGLQGEGFRFTSMGELGNTAEVQSKLYRLNAATASDVPGTEGEKHWDSFEDFQKRVCQADWYMADGQMVVIDTATGEWVALSAITHVQGTDYAYNLHTGVDRRYRGRKLAQAVKVTALRYAREVLKVDTVRTHHNTMNLPMLAIDHKLGYILLPGTFVMENHLG